MNVCVPGSRVRHATDSLRAVGTVVRTTVDACVVRWDEGYGGREGTWTPFDQLILLRRDEELW